MNKDIMKYAILNNITRLPNTLNRVLMNLNRSARYVYGGVYYEYHDI
jgi:hypothetical protein